MVYIRRLLTMLFICLILFLLGCGDNRTSKQSQLDSPPALKIIYQDKSIDAITGTYSWTFDSKDGTKTSIEADSIAPPEVVKNSTSLPVSPNASLALNFTEKPADFTVYIWKENEPIQQSLIDDEIVAPESDGTVVYEVVGTWEQGIVHYAFSVIVDKKGLQVSDTTIS